MADSKPELPTRPTATSSSSNLPSGSVRQRLPQRQSSFSASPYRSDGASSSPKPVSSRRRSSLLSYPSFDLAEDIINPTANKRSNDAAISAEVSHWSSSPLAFAILPAIAGLLFNNGSAFATDALLLVIAGIFLNWSIRIPRDWYHSAQELKREVGPDYEIHAESPTEKTSDEVAVESASSDSSPKTKPSAETQKEQDQEQELEDDHDTSTRQAAAAELRRQEHYALAANFFSPAIAAYLLHLIRGQLSRPSTGLVSDYNLCIFLLAAEFWPCRQVARLMMHRTLHLQRVITSSDDPWSTIITEERSTMATLGHRIADLEGRLSNRSVMPNGAAAIAQKAEFSGLESELRKRYEPRLEGLERAVRRYEKRSTTMAMVTEQRLQSLETRLQDALSLAAVAAQHSRDQQSRRGGVLRMALSAISAAIALPMRVAWGLCIWPLLVLEGVYTRVRSLLLGPMPPKAAKSARSNGYVAVNKDERERAKEKEKLVTGKKNVR